MENRFSEETLKGLKRLGYDKLTPVQEKVMPQILDKKDVVVFEKTGEGKTLAFGIPIVEMVDWENKHPQALVVVPTRELAIQVAKEINKVGAFKKINAQVIFGKQEFDKERILLKQKCQIVVATVGRLVDHLERGTIEPKDIKTLVLDEFDELMKPGFYEDIESIISYIPNKPQMVMVSATVPENMDMVTRKYLSEPFVYSHIDEKTTNSTIEEFFVINEDEIIYRAEQALEIISEKQSNKTLIFVNTRQDVEDVYSIISRFCKFSYKIHGDLGQRDRIKAVSDFSGNNGGSSILISTNVTARGIHVNDVELIINLEMPNEDEKYIHRIGRTGRAGAKGLALTFIREDQKEKLKNLNRKEILEYPYEKVSIANVKKYFAKRQVIIEEIKAPVSKELSVVKLFLGAGKNKKMRPLDIVGAITSIEGVTGDDIGVISILKDASYVDILNAKEGVILAGIKAKGIKGKKVKAMISRHSVK